MSILTQGTELFFIDPDADSTGDYTVIKVGGVTAFNPGGTPADQIEDTTLDATTRTYKRGLRTPAQATVTLNFDPTDSSHVRLYALFSEDTDRTIEWAVGFSDAATDPTTSSSGLFTLPTDRTWFTFDGFVSDFPLDFAVNSVVSTQMTITRSGKGEITEATT